MDYIDLQGKKVSNITNQDKLLSFLYTNIFGRMLLKPLIQPQVSKLAGRYLSSAHSKWLISNLLSAMKLTWIFMKSVTTLLLMIFSPEKSSRTAGLFRRTLMSLSVHVTVWQRFIQFRRTQHFPLKIQNTPCVLCFAVHA